MYQRILVATDGSDLAGKALDHGIRLSKAVGARLVVVTVTEMWSAMDMARKARAYQTDAIEVYEKAEAAHADEVLSTAVEHCRQAGVDCETRHVSDQRPSDGILLAAVEAQCDLIVMATHGRRGMNRVFLGSAAIEVVTRSPVPVLVLR